MVEYRIVFYTVLDHWLYLKKLSASLALKSIYCYNRYNKDRVQIILYCLSVRFIVSSA